MSSKTVVRVTILGEEYALRSAATAEHTRAVASHVDRAIRDVMASAGVVEAQKAAILAALEITDQLFRARSAEARLRAGISELSAEVRRWLPPSKRDP